MLQLRSLLFTILLVFIFYACKKENINTNTQEGTTINMMTSRWYDSLFYRSFIYDNMDRLFAITDSDNNGNKYRIFPEYNLQGKLSGYNLSFNSTGRGSVIIPYTFVYDGNGRIIQKLSPPVSVNGSPVRNSYRYDASGRLIDDSLYSYWSNEIYSYSTYSYEGNDNIWKRENFINNSGSYIFQDSTLFTYDNEANPTNNLGTLLYYFFDHDSYLCKNNRIQIKYADGTIVTYLPEYQNNGLPKKISDMSNADYEYDEFYYE